MSANILCFGSKLLTDAYSAFFFVLVSGFNRIQTHSSRNCKSNYQIAWSNGQHRPSLWLENNKQHYLQAVSCSYLNCAYSLTGEIKLCDMVSASFSHAFVYPAKHGLLVEEIPACTNDQKWTGKLLIKSEFFSVLPPIRIWYFKRQTHF